MSANKSDSTPHRRSDDANRVPDNTNIAEAVVPPLVGVSTTGNDPAEDSDHAEKVSPPTSTTSKNSSFRPPSVTSTIRYE